MQTLPPPNQVPDSAPRTAEDPDAVWTALFRRQRRRYRRWMAPELDRALEQLPLASDRAPTHDELSAHLAPRIGWRMAAVPGLIPVDEFFALLRARRFPSPTWLRHESELDYTPAPDLFHDVVGHVPQLLVPELRAAIENLAARAEGSSHDELVRLERVYWFTIEFGVVATAQGVRAYGAGLGSSPAELERAVGPTVGPTARHFPCDFEAMASRDFETTSMQETYFVARDLAEVAKLR